MKNAKSEVTGWGPRALRQTKSVCHSRSQGPMTRIVTGAAKQSHGQLGDSFAAP